MALPSIGINFVDSGDDGVRNGAPDALGAGESAGAPGYAQTNWNNFGRWGQTVGTNSDTGAATGVTATWDSNNVWISGSGTATPDNKLMHGYIDSLGLPNQDSPFQFFGNVGNPATNDNRPIVWVANLNQWLASVGASSYSVVVYTDGDATEGRVGEYWLQGASGGDPPNALGSDLTPHLFASDTSNFSGSYVQVSNAATSVGAAEAGNFLVFTGVSGDSFLLRTEERDFRAQINGMQIIAEVPEPGAIGLIGLAGAMLLRRRK
jgi:hypothetical protein